MRSAFPRPFRHCPGGQEVAIADLDYMAAAALRSTIAAESRLALWRGARLLTLLATMGLAVMSVIAVAGLVENAIVPVTFCVICIVVSRVTWYAAEHDLVRRPHVVYGVSALLCLLPVTLFVLAHFLSPAGAGTWFFGPITTLWFLLIIVAGFQFDARVAHFAGAVSACGYLLTWWLAAPWLDQVQTPHPVMKQELTMAYTNVFRAVFMLFAGVAVGGIATTARKLLVRVLQEEREKQGISRLFGEYVSPEVRERLVHQSSGAEAERRDVVILFSDIRGYTALSESLPPEAFVRQLNEYFDAMVTEITLRGGTVDKFIGDAVMAVFGGLLPLEKPSQSAVEAAQAMRGRLVEMNRSWVARGWPALDNGIGIARGEVLQGSIGSKNRKEFTVIGDAVNTAARLEAATKDLGHPIALSARVFSELTAERQASCISLGAVALKGKSAAVEVYGARDLTAEELRQLDQGARSAQHEWTVRAIH